MSEYEDILEEFNNDKERTAVDRAIALAKNNEEKANITITQKGIEDYIQLIITIIIVITGVNWIFDIPLLWHSYGHFGFLTHFGTCFKELYFGWGYNHDKFLFSLEGIRSYIYVIPAIYDKLGFWKFHWCMLTQFSPIWGFTPLCVFIQYILYIKAENLNKEAKALAKFLDKKARNEAKNNSGENTDE